MSFILIPDDRVTEWTSKHYAMAEPVPPHPDVKEWCDANLRGPVRIEAIYSGGPMTDDSFNDMTFDYYIHFENEVDLINFKCRWF